MMHARGSAPPLEGSPGRRLREVRQRLGLTLTEVSRRSKGEFSTSWVSAVERNIWSPDKASMERLTTYMRLLGVKPEDIFGRRATVPGHEQLLRWLMATSPVQVTRVRSDALARLAEPEYPDPLPDEVLGDEWLDPSYRESAERLIAFTLRDPWPAHPLSPGMVLIVERGGTPGLGEIAVLIWNGLVLARRVSGTDAERRLVEVGEPHRGRLVALDEPGVTLVGTAIRAGGWVGVAAETENGGTTEAAIPLPRIAAS